MSESELVDMSDFGRGGGDGTQMIPMRQCGPSDHIIVEVGDRVYKLGRVKLNWWTSEFEWVSESLTGGTETHKLKNCTFTVDSIGK